MFLYPWVKTQKMSFQIIFLSEFKATDFTNEALFLNVRDSVFLIWKVCHISVHIQSMDRFFVAVQLLPNLKLRKFFFRYYCLVFKFPSPSLG